jgi:DNA (cytosine-5)-methyltransferase 1
MKLFNGLIVSGLSVHRQCPTWRSEVFLSRMTHGSLFSGIGGFDLAAQWMGWENKFHCEWNEFGQKVLHHYWPEAELFTDITKSDFTTYHGTIDVISGGFPCQPYSMAGKRLGKEDDRHLWPEMLRVIREVRPRWVVGENVLGLVNWNGGLVFHEVQTNLEAEGYEVQPYVLPAAAVGAPHRRDRVWFVAHYKGTGITPKSDIREWSVQKQELQNRHQLRNLPYTNGKDETATDTDLHGRNECNCEHEEQSSKRGVNAQRDIEPSVGNGNVDNTNGIRRDESINDKRHINEWEGKRKFSATNSTQEWWGGFPSVSPVCSGNDGIPNELDGITFSKWRNESIKAYGNAVVPQVVYQIFKAIQEYENMHK